MNKTLLTLNTDQPADWLNLARENAAVCGDATPDLGRAIVRLATLAAAAHRSALLDDPLPVSGLSLATNGAGS